ncbi:MAG: response regulator [Candidatus Bipolaricaulota bacterium]
MVKNNGKRLRILLVEDDEYDVQLTERALSKSDVDSELYVVWDGEEAMDFLYQRGEFEDSPEPDLVLLDLKLPKIGGHEVLEKVKEDESLRHIPVIVLTVSEREEDMVKAYDSGASSYIHKPVKPDEFGKVIQTVQEYWKMSELPPR